MSCDPALWWNEGAFLYLGRMGANKGVEHVIEAWCALKRDDLGRCPDLWLVGGSPDEIMRTRQQVASLPGMADWEASGRIRWWGYLNDEGISALLLKTVALIMHSSYEPGGRVILEAMTQCVPVIATPHGFALDLVRDWETGFIVPHGDILALQRRMTHFVRQPLLGISLGFAAGATAHKALSDWDFFQAHEEVYLRALSQATPKVIEAPAATPCVIENPLPHGLAGRYPFPPVVPGKADALCIAARTLGMAVDECLLREAKICMHSLVWLVEGGGTIVVVKHAYTSFTRRPLWDRSCRGPLFRPGRERRRNELTAACLPGFVPIIAQDELLGLHVLPYLPEIAVASPLEEVRVALFPLNRLWHAPVPAEVESTLSTAAGQWWRDRAAKPWRNDEALAADLRCVSVRVAWAELTDKAAAGDLPLPLDISTRLLALVPLGDAIAQSEPDVTPLVFQHGDFARQHVRQGQRAGPR